MHQHKQVTSISNPSKKLTSYINLILLFNILIYTRTCKYLPNTKHKISAPKSQLAQNNQNLVNVKAHDAMARR